MNEFNNILHIFVLLIVANCIIQGNCKSSDILKSAADLLDKEAKRLKSESVTCPGQPKNLNDLDAIRVIKKVNEAISCHIYYLTSNRDAGWAWSGLASLYQAANSRSQASVCFKQAAKLDGTVSHAVKTWHFLGPFVIGKTEIDGDPVEALGGIQNISHTRFLPEYTVVSELAPSAEISWSILSKRSTNNYISIAPNMPWHELVNSLGSSGIMEWQGWAVGEIAVNSQEADVLVRCAGVHTIFIDASPVVGDVYGREQFRFSVVLTSGIHVIYVRPRAKVSLAFRCDFQSADGTFDVHSPHFLPDLVDGRLFSGFVSIPIANFHHSHWLRNIRVSLDESSESSHIHVKAEKNEFAVAPGQIRLIRFEFQTVSDDFVLSPCADLPLTVKVSTSEGFRILPIVLRCRKSSESFLFTFIDHDGSVQHAAAVRPAKPCLGGLEICPTVLTLHGTTVPPQNQADSYKRMVNKKFVFGFERAWVLAPTRHGAHNWEGPGALTALTALKELARLTSLHSWIKRRSSDNLVIYAGHSMGGHGAWHLSTHYPDMALALVSLAGWIHKEDYGDSNLFFRHDIAGSHVDVGVKAVMEKCISENNADRFVSNLKGISVMIRVGAKDRTVHPFYSRRMYRLLVEAGINVTYRELSDKEHWWWDTRDINDGGCVNDQELRDFTNSYLSPPLSVDPQANCDADTGDHCDDATQESIYKAPEPSQNFTYTVVNPAFGGTVRGLQVLQQFVPHQISTITAEVDEKTASLTTDNVRSLRIQTTGVGVRSINWTTKTMTIDGDHLSIDSDAGTACLCKDDVTGIWNAVDDCCNQLDMLTERGPLTVGPARRVAESAFVIVIGTVSGSLMTSTIERLAVYIANLFLLTSDTVAPVIKDKDLTDDTAERFNLIVIGGPDENLFAQRYLDRVPVSSQNGVLSLGRCQYRESKTGLLTLAPHSSSRLALVLLGNSVDGLMDIVSLASPTIPPMTRSPFSNMVPDFVITGPRYRAHGPGGYLCTGFWGNRWDARRELISCSHCL